jgi:hypothetical protein
MPLAAGKADVTAVQPKIMGLLSLQCNRGNFAIGCGVHRRFKAFRMVSAGFSARVFGEDSESPHNAARTVIRDTAGCSCTVRNQDICPFC